MTRGYPNRIADKKFRKGDKVQWRSHRTTVTGTVQREITSDTEAAGRTVRASKDQPQYRVRSDKTGADAVQKPSALHPHPELRYVNNMTAGDLEKWLKTEPNSATSSTRTSGQAISAVHRAQRPPSDVSDTTWRYSLMNWGHDPTRTPRLPASSPSPVSSL